MNRNMEVLLDKVARTEDVQESAMIVFDYLEKQLEHVIAPLRVRYVEAEFVQDLLDELKQHDSDLAAAIDTYTPPNQEDDYGSETPRSPEEKKEVRSPALA